MNFISFHPPEDSEWTEAFGWARSSVNECSENVTKENRYILYNNIANIAGYVISPIIGLIRIIANSIFLVRGKNLSYTYEWEDGEKSYLRTQIARGIFELLGGGYILWIPDLIATIGRKCSY